MKFIKQAFCEFNEFNMCKILFIKWPLKCDFIAFI